MLTHPAGQSQRQGRGFSPNPQPSLSPSQCKDLSEEQGLYGRGPSSRKRTVSTAVPRLCVAKEILTYNLRDQHYTKGKTEMVRNAPLHCWGHINLLQILLLAHELSSCLVSGPRQSYSRRAPVLACAQACPCHPAHWRCTRWQGRRAGPRLEHNSKRVALPPCRSSATGCIWSFYFHAWVDYSQCPNIRKRQHQKQSPQLAIPRAELATPNANTQTSTSVLLTVSPTDAAFTQAPFPDHPGEFQAKGSPGGS